MGVDPRSLQIGQIVSVKDLNFGVLIDLCGDGEAGWTVIETNAEYLILDDDAGNGCSRRIPLYLINQSTHMHMEETPEAA